MMKSPPTKICSKCEITKPVSDFYMRSVSGKKYPESRCKICSAERTKDRKAADPDYAKRYVKTAVENQKKKLIADRANNHDTYKFIYHDTRKSDKRKGFENDLDLLFVKDMVSKPCHYCNDTATKMSLDRIDNNLGHTKQNVIQSCVRCNLTRGNMPFAAWLVVAKGMREALALGLFNDWTGPKAGRRKMVEIEGIEPFSQLPCKGGPLSRS